VSEEFKKALLVEDEVHLATAIQIALKELEIETVHVSTLKEAKKKYREQEFDLIILDRMLPDGEGLEFFDEGLEKDGAMVMVLSAKGDVSDRIEGIERGADEYLPKPFSWEEFSARVKMLYRRKMKNSSPEVETWKIDENTLVIHGPKGPVELTVLEFKLAKLLILRAGEVIPRDELLKKVWGFTLIPKTRTVDHFLGRLRKYFELEPDKPEHFLSVRGVGYKFIP